MNDLPPGNSYLKFLTHFCSFLSKLKQPRKNQIQSRDQRQKKKKFIIVPVCKLSSTRTQLICNPSSLSLRDILMRRRAVTPRPYGPVKETGENNLKIFCLCFSVSWRCLFYIVWDSERDGEIRGRRAWRSGGITTRIQYYNYYGFSSTGITFQLF